jgi:hypothetical protein
MDMPYRLVEFAPGLVQVEVCGHIETDDVDAIRDEGELMLRHVVEPFDAIVDATGFTGLNPLALAGLQALPLPPQLRSVAVVLSGWQRLAARALPRVEGLAFVGSVEEARRVLPSMAPLAVGRAEPVAAEAPLPEPAPVAVAASAPEPAAAPAPAPEPLPQLRRLPTRPLPPAHRRPAARPASGLAGSMLRGLAGQMNRVSRRLEQLRDW